MIWKGLTVSVNKWTRSRVIKSKKTGKLIPMVYSTKEYKDFIKGMAEAFLNSDKHGTDYVDVEITCTMWKMRDTDSIIKPVLDAIEQSGVLENDRYVRDIRVKRLYNDRDDPDEVRVRVIPADWGVR